MKKKILIACNNLHVGGIQRSLINLLNEISNQYDVTLFLFYPQGEYTIPKGVRVICGNRFTKIMGMSQGEAEQDGAFTRIWRAGWTVVTRLVGCGIPFRILCAFQRLHEEYDVAISFMQNSAFRYFYGGCNEFIVNSVRAKWKISFVHCDFAHYFGNNAYNRKYYRHFDRIACVSDSCKRVFDAACPELAERTTVVHNCYCFSEMQEMAQAFEAEHTPGKVNLFTSARISEEKGIFRMIGILERLKKSGCDFVWRIAGGGALYEKAVEMSRKAGLTEQIIFLGIQNNPYPYFKSADLLLVPSYDEAAPMVFGEAMAFGLPILTTDTTSAKELVADLGIGFVCENSDLGIETALRNLLCHPELLKRYRRETDNRTALCEFMAVCEGSENFVKGV